MELTEHIFETRCGSIHYWMNEQLPDRPTLVFLPGLTVSHNLFDKQIEHFADSHNCIAWDAPAHGASRPFLFDFTLEDKARWLKEILDHEGVESPILIGQSMGGYVSQMFIELFPGSAGAFVSIDSCSLKRTYITAFDLWSLKRCEPMYRAFPWNLLLKMGSEGNAETLYGRELVLKMWTDYSKNEYCKLAGHGFAMLAYAIETYRNFDLDCPTMLLCGTKDRAGSAKRYGKAWAAGEGLPFYWIEGAGHCSNVDNPTETNILIEAFLSCLDPR